MKREVEDSLMVPALDVLQDRIPQKYELVLAATRRAKQILRQQQLNNATEEDGSRMRKPLSLALQEIAEGRVGVEQLNEPDILVDDYEEEQQDFFPELERFHREPEDAMEEGIDGDEDLDDLEDEEDLDEDLEEPGDLLEGGF